MQEVGDEQGGAITFECGVGGHDDFGDTLFADAVHQLVDREVFGADAFERSDAATEDVIHAPPDTGGFEGDDISRLFHDADGVLIASRVAAHAADGFFGEVEADGAAADCGFDIADGICQRGGFCGGDIEDVIGEAFGGFATDSGQFTEFIDESGDGLTVGVILSFGLSSHFRHPVSACERVVVVCGVGKFSP